MLLFRREKLNLPGGFANTREKENDMASISNVRPLDSGTAFPPLLLTSTHETAISVPGNFEGFTVVLIYRGKW